MNPDIQAKIQKAKELGVSDEAIQQRLQERGLVPQQKDEGFKFSSLLPIAGGIAGGIGGGLVSSPSILGIPAGVMAGGAAGSAGGEALRQGIEGEKDFGKIAREGAYGLAGGPIGKVASVPLKLLARGLFRLGLGPGGGAGVELGLKGGSPQAIRKQLFEGSGSIVEGLKEKLGGLIGGKTGMTVGALKDQILGLGRNPEVIGLEEKGLERLPPFLTKRANLSPLQKGQSSVFNKLNELLAEMKYSDTTKIPLGDLDLLKQLAQTTGGPAIRKETPYALPEFASRLGGVLRENIEKASGNPKEVARLNELIASAGKIGENVGGQMGFGRRVGLPVGAASIPSIVGLLTGNPFGGLAVGGGALALTNPKIATSLASALLSKLAQTGLFGAGQIPARLPEVFQEK